MIDPHRITRYDRSEWETEEFWMFCIAVAGKSASTISRLLDALLRDGGHPAISPLEAAMELDRTEGLEAALKKRGFGQQKRVARAWRDTAQRLKGRLSEIDVEECETVPGVGPKTSRFFVLHSRDIDHLAVLDRHILAWMRDEGYDVPDATPQNAKTYAAIERDFVGEAKARGIGPAALDLGIWRERTSSPDVAA